MQNDTPNPTPNDTGEQVRAARRRAGLNRAQLAGRAACSPSTVTNIEDGYAPKGSRALGRINAVLAELNETSS